MVGQTQRPWVRENPTSCLTQDPMSDIKKRFSPTLRNIYKKQHGAQPCLQLRIMQLIFFVPPNEELEGYIAPPKIWMYPQK